MRLPEYFSQLDERPRQVMQNTPATPAKLVELPKKSYNEQMIEENMRYNREMSNFQKTDIVVKGIINLAKIGVQLGQVFTQGEINRQNGLAADLANDAIRAYNEASMEEVASSNTIDQSKERLDSIEQKYDAIAQQKFGSDSIAYRAFNSMFKRYVTSRLDQTMFKKQKVYLDRLKNNADNLITRGIIENNPDLIESAVELLGGSGYYTYDEIKAIRANANSNRIKQSVIDKLPSINSTELENFLINNKGNPLKMGFSSEEAEWLINADSSTRSEIWKEKEYQDKVNRATVRNAQIARTNELASMVFDNTNPLTLKRLRAELVYKRIGLEDYKKLESLIKDRDSVVKQSANYNKIINGASKIINEYRTGKLSETELNTQARAYVAKYSLNTDDREKIVSQIVKYAKAKDSYDNILNDVIRNVAYVVKPSKSDKNYQAKLAAWQDEYNDFMKLAQNAIYQARDGSGVVDEDTFRQKLTNIAHQVFSSYKDVGQLSWDKIYSMKDEYGAFGILPKSDVSNVTGSEALLTLLSNGEGIGLDYQALDDKVRSLYNDLNDRAVAMIRDKGITGKVTQSIDSETLVPTYTVFTDKGPVQFMLDAEDTEKGGKVLKLVTPQEFYNKHPKLKYGIGYGLVEGDNKNATVYLPDRENEKATLAGTNVFNLSDFRFVKVIPNTNEYIAFLGTNDELKNLDKKKFLTRDVLNRFYLYIPSGGERGRFKGRLSWYYSNKEALDAIWTLIEKRIEEMRGKM